MKRTAQIIRSDDAGYGWFSVQTNQLADPSINKIPVVVMSADGHVAEKTLKASAVEYLKKPVDTFHLLEVVEKYP